MNLSEEALSIQTEDNTPYERPFKGDNNPTYPYDLKELSEANGGFDILKGTPVGNTLVVDFAIAAIAGEGLGRDAYTDLLAVSFSSTDYVGHQFGVHAWETMDTYVRLDQQLARFFRSLDQTVGAGQWMCWLTADHGAQPCRHLAQDAGIPVDYWQPGNSSTTPRRTSMPRSVRAKWVLNYSNDQFFLNRPLIRERGLDLEAMQQRVQALALDYEGVFTAVTGTDFVRGNTQRRSTRAVAQRLVGIGIGRRDHRSQTRVDPIQPQR